MELMDKEQIEAMIDGLHYERNRLEDQHDQIIDDLQELDFRLGELLSKLFEINRK